MAIARTSPIIGGISGTLGSHTFRNTRNGLIIAAHGRKTSQQTQLQTRTAANLAKYQDLWQGLTLASKTAWNNAAAAVTWPNRLGIPKHPSGRSCFLSANCHFWSPDWDPYVTSPNDLAELGQPLMPYPAYPQTPPPTSWSAVLSLSDPFEITSDSPILPDPALYEFLWFSPWVRPGQTSTPQRWIKLGRLQKSAATLDWSSFLVRCPIPAALNQSIAIAITWQRFPSVQSTRVWQIYQVTA